MKRISLIFRAKANKALDRAEDPRETLDYSYKRQLELLTKVRRGVADVATSRKRVELQVAQLKQQSDKLTEQAQKALSMGREDLAREALTRKSALTSQMTTCRPSRPSCRARRRSSRSPPSGCRPRSSPSARKKETIKAKYTAAEAQTRINEAFSGISEEMGDVGMAVQRAEDKTAQMQARAGAIDELIASGALDDASSINRGDDISRELEAMSSQSDVETELAALKAEQRPPQALEQADSTPPAQVEATPRAAQQGGRPGMIVRILGEGQWDVEDADVDALNELDASVESAVDGGDQHARSRRRLDALLDRRPRRWACRCPTTSLVDSDLILPPSDATLEEVRELLSDDGLIPG